jgi:hypothetical protein
MSGLTYEPYRPYRPSRVGRPHPQAVTALAFGVVGLVGIVFPPLLILSPMAVRTALRARRAIRRDPESYVGASLVKAALITGIIGCVVAALLVLALVAAIGLVAWLLVSIL